MVCVLYVQRDTTQRRMTNYNYCTLWMQLSASCILCLCKRSTGQHMLVETETTRTLVLLPGLGDKLLFTFRKDRDHKNIGIISWVRRPVTTVFTFRKNRDHKNIGISLESGDQ